MPSAAVLFLDLVCVSCSCDDPETALEFCEIQNHVIGGDVLELMEFLRKKALGRSASGDLKRLSFYAHIAVFYKVVVYMHLGSMIQVCVAVCARTPW